ncbi:MAG: aldolase/citrate lyase family protein [Pseudomonadota bacterium]
MAVTAAERLAAIAGGAEPGTPVGCVWLGLGDPAVAEIAALAGHRVGVIDTEHGTVAPSALPNLLRALALHGASGLVRVGGIHATEAKRALDAGAAGILFPQVETVAEARAAAAATRFPPAGRRGTALGVVRAAGFGAEAGYADTWNDRVLTAVQIESRAGLAQADEIAAVDGVDLLFFGPYDYALDLGLDPAQEGELLEAAFTEVLRAARVSGKIAGVFPWPGADPAALAAAGASLIAIASDVRLLADGFAGAASALSVER